MSQFDRFANAARTILTQTLTSGTTSFSVSSISSFPAPPFNIVIDNEIMKVYYTRSSDNTFQSVLRAQEGTSGVAHSSGASVAHVLTKDALLNLATDNSVQNCALSSSTTDPYASDLSYSYINLVPKDGNKIALVDPVENVWRTFSIEPAGVTQANAPVNNFPSPVTGDVDKIVDVYAYWDDTYQRVKLYQSAPWDFTNPNGRPAQSRVSGVVTRSSYPTYRYLDSYQIINAPPLSSGWGYAVFGWKTQKVTATGNIALYHNNFPRIKVNQSAAAGSNVVYCVQKGYDGQRVVMLNDSSYDLLVAPLAVDTPSGFATTWNESSGMYRVQPNAGVELYYDSCYQRWNIVKNSTIT